MTPSTNRIALVLSAGGLRGAAHLGVLRELLRHEIPFDILVGASAGAIVGAFYAAVGLSVEEMIEEARTFKGRHVILHGLTLRAPEPLRPLLNRFCGVVPERLRQLDRAEFDKLYFGVKGLGIVCHDLITDRPIYFASGRAHSASLAEVVKASASIPGVIPTRVVQRGGVNFHLVDGGLSDPLPITFARSKDLGASRLIVSDCRRFAQEVPEEDDLVYIRPQLDHIAVLRSPRASLLEAVEQGRIAVTERLLRKIRGWLKPVGVQ